MASPDRIDELKKRYDENPRRFFASLANEYRKAGDLDQAIALCQTHLAEQPSNMNGHVVYGQALFEAGRYDEAKGTFETALTLDPENLIALRHLGDIACTNGANDQARGWYERVLDADPRNEEIIALLAHLESAAKAPPPPVAESGDVTPLRGLETTEFRPPTVITPTVAATPVIPIESVTAGEMLAVAPEPLPHAPRESLGLMDLSIDFNSTVETPASGVAAEPPVTAPANDLPAFDDLDFSSAPAFDLPPASAPAEAPADAAGEALDDLAIDPFAAETGSAMEPWNSAPAEAASREAAEDMLFGDSTPAEPAAPFVTETMAELYLQQGFTTEALEVYRQLSARFPDDENLAERVRKLERGDRSSLSLDIVDDVPEEARGSGAVALGAMLDETPPVGLETVATPVSVPAQPEARQAEAVQAEASVEESGSAPEPSAASTVRSYLAGLAARRAVKSNGRASVTVPAAAAPGGSLDVLFGGGAVASEDETVALAIAQVATGVGTSSASVKGRPTAPAATELSLDSVFSAFREADARPAATVQRQSQSIRFDQFFATGDEGSAPAQAPAPAVPAGEPGSPAELQQFQSWLQGLKKP